jgi:hypothetical protein
MGVGIYVWRYHECSRIGQLFKKTNGYVHINLQLATYVDNFLTVIYGFCCFFGTMKLIRLCRFNQRLYLFVRTLKKAGKALISFAMMFSLVFFAFLSLFYLLFQSKLSACSSLYQTVEMLFQMTVMKYNVHDLSGAATFLGPICFSLFIIIVVFVCLNMFISIIIESFRQVRKNVHRGENEEIFSFMLERFVRWIGK